MRQFFLVLMHVLVIADAHPFKIEEVKKAFEIQDKICSQKFQESRGSYSTLFETITGFRVPNYIPESSRRPYTGFKFLRVYNLQVFSMTLNSSLKIIFCDKGKVQWEVSRPLFDDIDWDKPICVYTPADGAKRNNGSKKKGKWAEWYQSKRSKKSSLKTVSLKAQAKENLRHLNCFKLARRKKYYSRRSSLFFPGSWVGGIFFCDITDDTKSLILDRTDSNLEFSGKEGYGLCTLENSIPLFPLESDDYSKNWAVYDKPKVASILGKWLEHFQITKYVPYLYTPNNPLASVNFETSNLTVDAIAVDPAWRKPFREQILDMIYKEKLLRNSDTKWFSEIEVEEKYDMNSEEISKISGLADKTIRKVTEMTSKPNNNLRTFFSASNFDLSHKLNKKYIRKLLMKIETRIWDHLSQKDKTIAVMGYDPPNLGNLELEWKNLELSPENYNYTCYDTRLEKLAL